MTREQELAAALLWLRNHYELGSPALKEAVLDRTDRVLAAGAPVTGEHSRQLRERYPVVGT